jgi:hypothetical protein
VQCTQVREAAAVIVCGLMMLTGCGRVPDSYAIPAQYAMPPGADPSVLPGDPNRPFLVVSEPDASNFFVRDIVDTRDGVEFRATGADPAFRFPAVQPGQAYFHVRYYVHPDQVRIKGVVTLTVLINGRRLGQLTSLQQGVFDQRLPILPGMLTSAGPVELTIHVDPLWGDKGEYGILIHSVGFEERVP